MTLHDGIFYNLFYPSVILKRITNINEFQIIMTAYVIVAFLGQKMYVVSHLHVPKNSAFALEKTSHYMIIN